MVKENNVVPVFSRQCYSIITVFGCIDPDACLLQETGKYQYVHRHIINYEHLRIGSCEGFLILMS